MLKLNDRVVFTRMNYGKDRLETFNAVIVDIETHEPFGKPRYGLKVENNPFLFETPYFFEQDLTKI